ncbi:alpha/beta hydrolase family protein [Silvibacterium acidisoli]|uniref:alpha/beta hydrolase family protein n=1 Tax=Acidobacteriaceae bacterium ZG23-2 TaxID=2883246 RepID=UPI00406D180E
MKHPLIPSHGSNLLGVFYLAAGAGPHPTAVLFHGFPGYEQNLDLAQELRRAGWNVLAVHYRGSWGVAGKFSFLGSAEDADAEVNFVLDPRNTAEYRIDPDRIVVIGHSMGGFMAASAAAHNPRVKAAVLLSAWNIGAARPNEADEAKALASGENLAPISGTDGTTLAHEEFTHRAELDMVNLAPSIAPRPVLIVTAHDGSDQFAVPFTEALRSAGDTHISHSHFETDHSYSGKRLELANVVLDFLKTE